MNTYEHFYELGRMAAIGGNYWLTSCPFEGWQGEAWKDGNWQEHHIPGSLT